jgi:PAS domain S-box-containing protein
MRKDSSSDYNEFTHRLKELERKLQDQRLVARYDREEKCVCDYLVHNGPDVIFKLDSSGKIEFVNRAVHAYGYMPAKLMGRYLWEIVRADDAAQLRQLLQETRTGDGGPRSVRIRFITGGKKTVDMEIKCQLVDFSGAYSLTPPKTRMGILGIARETTIQKETVRTVSKASTGNEHILLVDDESTVLEITAHILEKLGYRVTSKSSGSSALESFQANPAGFDLLITDLTMPGISGIGLVQKIREIREDIPVIFFSGSGSGLVKTNPPGGVWDFVSKPILAKNFAVTIREVLDKKEKQVKNRQPDGPAV